MDDKKGYLNFSVVADTIFSYYDTEEQVRKEIAFDPIEPEDCIKAVAAIIQKYGIETVVCNKIGYGLCGSISQYLKSTYNNNTCFFELNDI